MGNIKSGSAAAPARKPQWQESNAIAEWFAGKRPEDLDIVEFGEQRLYPDSLKRRSTKDPDKLVEARVRIRPPTSRDKALARVDALVWAREIVAERVSRSAQLPDLFTIEQAESYLGRVYFDELDTKCIVARCTHEWEPPHDQYLLPEFLDKAHDSASIMDLWDRMNFWHSFCDVRVSNLSEEATLQVLAAIDRVRNVSPLVAIAGGARDNFIVSMAGQLLSLRTPKSSSGSTTT